MFLTRSWQLIAILAFSLASTHVLAQGATEKEVDYSVFSLEELFRVSVITASKQEEPLWDAPGVVTVIMANEIQKFGANNLWEILDRVPGVQKNFSSAVNSVSIRGGEGLTQSHILLLIDGRPLRTANGNLSIYNAWATFPINIIEKIEIVRGPGSVLYGTNAFEGVINVITKKSKTGMNLEVGGGSFTTRNSNLHLSYREGDLNIGVGMYYLDAAGWEFDSNALDSNGDGPIDVNDRNNAKAGGKVFEDDKSIRVKVDYKDFSLSAYYGITKQFTESEFQPGADGWTFQSNVTLLDLGYQFNFNEKYRLEINATWNQEDFKWHNTPESKPQIPLLGRDTMLEVALHGKVNDEFNFLIGSNYQYWDADNPDGELSGFFDESTNVEGHYTQATYRPNRFLKIIAGTQINKVDGSSTDVVPRFGSILNFSPRLGVKLLYGQAFRSPILQDKLINTPVNLGLPSLKSEKISTLNAQFFYQGDKKQLIITLFDSKEKNLIRGVPPTDEMYDQFQMGWPDLSLEDFLSYRIVAQNIGQLDIRGGEIETKYLPTANWFLMLSATYQENEGSEKGKNATLAPNYSLKAGFSYTQQGYSISLFNTYYTESQDNMIVNPNSITLNPKSKPSNLLSGNFAFYFRSIKKLDLSLEVYGVNLLNEKVWVHELPFDRVNTIPGAPPRSAYGSLKLKF